MIGVTPELLAAPWVCATCGSHVAGPGTCCGEPRLDLREERVRDLLRDIDLRAEQRRETRARFLGTGIGVVAVIALWCVPGYWTLRQAWGLPFLADQWAFMILIALGVMKLLGRGTKRFPYVDETTP